MLETREMRDVYIEELINIAEKDPRIVLLEADMSKSGGSEKFRKKLPDRFINVGIAEANMVSVAAGLANYGRIAFTDTFTPFAARRPLDQIAISVAYTGLNVKMVGLDPGICAELNGGTHMSVEDVGALRSIPGLTIVEPIDTNQLKKLLPQIIEHDGPIYIRLFRKLAEKIYDEDTQFELGKAVTLRKGTDAAIIASGIMTAEALIAADKLSQMGIKVKVVQIHTIKPIDKDAIILAASETGAVVTAENHNIIGGLGSAVCEVLSEVNPIPVKRIGIRDHFGEVGKMPYLKEKYKMTAEDIIEAVLHVIKMK